MEKESVILEVAAFTHGSAIIAAKAGADRIIILPGGGIITGNAKNIIQRNRVHEIHFCGKELVTSYMQPKEGISLTSHGQVSDYEWYECDS